MPFLSIDKKLDKKLFLGYTYGGAFCDLSLFRLGGIMKISFEKYDVSICRGAGVLLPPTSFEGCFCFLQIVSGHAAVDIGLSRFEGSRGDIFHFSAELLHTVRSKDECIVRRLVYPRNDFTPEDRFEEEIFSLFLLETEQNPSLYAVGHPLHKTLTYRLESIVEEWCGKELYYTTLIHSEIGGMLIALLRSYGYEQERGEIRREGLMRLRPVLEKIHNDYADKLTLSSLASMLSLSEDHFGKLFRDAMGKTPVEYIHFVRINRAMRDMLLCDDAIADIAKRCGFMDISYFYKVFKELCGKTPASIRKLKKSENTHTL